MTEAEQERWQTWLADPAHAQAFARACAVWDGAGALRPAFADARAQPRAGVLRLAGRHALAGALAAAAIALVLPWSDWSADYRTERGEIARMVLPDGSHATLDTDTALAVDFEHGARRVTLLHGQAWFEVRHDARHPFAVDASDGRISDMGTVFDVRADGDVVCVSVESGVVQVTRRGRAVLLRSGETADYGSKAALATKATGTNPGAWRGGRLIFAGQPLSAVLAELARYRGDRLVLFDRDAGNRPVSAIVQVTRLEAGLDALAETQNLRVTRLPWLTVLTTK